MTTGTDKPLLGIHSCHQYLARNCRDADQAWRRLCGGAGGKIYVIGGAGYHPGQKEDVSISATVPHRSVATNEVYDPATNTWETRMPMNVPRNHHAGAAVNGKIYAIGGRVGWSFVGSSSVDTVEEYDPATDRWRVRSRMIYPRSGMAYGTDGRLIYARRRIPRQRNGRCVPQFRGIRPCT